MSKPYRTPALLALLAACMASVSTTAQAHTGALSDAAAGHSHAFFSGLLHPLSGADHLAAMLAVGLWSALTARRMWVAPLAFANLLLAGALMGMAGISLPLVEPTVASSLLVLGLLVGSRMALPAGTAAALVGGFALFHGLAHGTELAGSHNMAALLGMLTSTLALHACGLVLGLALRTHSAWWARAAGAAVALTGGVLLAQMA
jgi:urease accessory protein